jgi:hypothetical protein
MAEHRIFPHGNLEPLAPNLWQVRGSQAMGLRRNMIVYRLPNSTLLLYSVVALDDEGMKALEALGRPALMVIPHKGHLMDAGFYRKRYPDLKVACPPEAKHQAEQRCGRVDGTPEELLKPLGIKVHPVHGCRMGEFAMELDIPGGAALVTNDIMGGRTPGERVNFVMRLIGPPAGHRLGIARVVRWYMVRNKVDVRGWLHLMAENSNIKLITASHAPPVDSDCAETLRDAATTI